MGLTVAKRGVEYRPTEADRRFVERAVMAGSRINDIAACLNITDDTLRKHFRYEIATARERLKGEAVRVIMDSLADGSLDAAKYVMARVGGWSERHEVEHSGEIEVTDARERLARLVAGQAAAEDAGGGSR